MTPEELSNLQAAYDRLLAQTSELGLRAHGVPRKVLNRMHARLLKLGRALAKARGAVSPNGDSALPEPTEHSSVARAILDTLRRHLKLTVKEVSVARPGAGQIWRMEAVSSNGERWAAEHPDHYKACCLLADLAGMDLEDG